MRASVALLLTAIAYCVPTNKKKDTFEQNDSFSFGISSANNEHVVWCKKAALVRTSRGSEFTSCFLKTCVTKNQPLLNCFGCRTLRKRDINGENAL